MKTAAAVLVCALSAMAQFPSPATIAIGGGVNTGRVLLSVPPSGTSADLWTVDDASGRQRWNLVRSADGVSYNILVSGGVSGGRRFLSASPDGAVVDLWTADDGSGRQRWFAEDAGAGLTRFRISGGVNNSRVYLSVTADGTAVGLFWADDGSGRQRWRVAAVPGVVQNATGPFFRLRSLANGLYLHQQQVQLAAGQIMPEWQSALWALEDNGQGFVRIRNRQTGTYLRIDGSGQLQSSSVLPGGDDSLWSRERTDSGVVFSNRASGRTLEATTNGPAAPESKPDRPTIYWTVEAESSPIVEEAKNYVLTAAHSLRCVDTRTDSIGGAVVQNGCDTGRSSQTWIQRTVNSPWTLYISSSSGKCMEVVGDPRQPGSPIQLADCDPNRTAQWFRAELDDSKGHIVTKGGQCLDVYGWSPLNDAAIVQWDCANQANQKFTHDTRPVTVVSAVTKSVMDTISQDVLGISDPDPDICWKNTTTRGVGKVPTTCPAGYPDYDGALVCYQACAAGYSGSSWGCWQRCPGGYTDIGVSCAKPSAYGRGTGYGWWFESPISRCQRDTGQSCEMWGALAYPTCAAGYAPFGCCICSPVCPNGMRDDGAFCAKNMYWRSSASTTCPAGEAYDAGLCYPQCPPASTGVGPVCWGDCTGDFPVGCGAACAKSTSACAFSIIEQVQSTADIAINVAGLVLTGGTANSAYKAARTAGKLAGKRAMSALAKQEMKQQLEKQITSAYKGAKKLRKVSTASRALDSSTKVSDTADVLVKAYEDGEFDWKTLVPTTAADFDPTGILGLVAAFNKPVCGR